MLYYTQSKKIQKSNYSEEKKKEPKFEHPSRLYKKFKHAYWINLLKKKTSKLVYAIEDSYCFIDDKKKKLNAAAILSILIYIGYHTFKYFWDGSEYPFDIIVYVVGTWIAVVIAYIYLNKNIFYKLKIHRDARLSDQWVILKMERFVKIDNPVGGGKDTLMDYTAHAFRRGKINEMNSLLERLPKIWYWVNFKELEVYLNLNYTKYMIVSKPNKIQIIKNDLSGINLVKKKYKVKFNTSEAVNDYEEFLKEPRFYKSKYVLDLKTKHIHIIEDIYDYIYSYIRINFTKNFMMMNQPVIEDYDTKLMAKQYSNDFLKSNYTAKEFVKKSYEDKIKCYTENIVKWGLEDHLFVGETEDDTWKQNVDKKTVSNIKSSGIRDTLAFIRHVVGEDFYFHSCGQNRGRVAAILREMQTTFEYIWSMEYVSNTVFTDKILKRINRFINNFVEFFEFLKNWKNKKIMFKKDKLIPVYQDIIDNTTIEKKRIKAMKKLSKINKRRFGDFHLQNRFFVRLRAKIDRTLLAHEGKAYIVMEINISKSETTKQGNLCKLKKVLKPSFHEQSYNVKLTFKKTDSWRNYNTHYLEDLIEPIKSNAQIDFYSTPRWSTSMKMKKDDLMFMNYERSFPLAQIDIKDVEEMNSHSFQLKTDKKGKVVAATLDGKELQKDSAEFRQYVAKLK